MEKTFLEELRIGDEALPQAVIDAIWQQTQQDQAAYEAQLKQVRFEGLLADGIRRSGGRNATAITALLDVAAIQDSPDPRAALDRAIGQLKKDSAYLFEAPTPPPYARGTGAADFREPEGPATLAAALRERFGHSA